MLLIIGRFKSNAAGPICLGLGTPARRTRAPSLAFAREMCYKMPVETDGAVPTPRRHRVRHSINSALAIAFVLLVGPAPLQAQSCQDEDAMVQISRQDLTGLVDAIKKESLQDFENKFHQKSSLSKLNFASGLTGELVACLDKAGQDPAATPDQKATYKTRQDAAAKLKEKLDHSRGQLKSAADAKSAKAILEKLNLAD